MQTRYSRSFTYRSRERIKAAKLIERLIQYVDGEVELSRQQAYVAMKLINKVLPDLRAISVEIDPKPKTVREMTTAELTACLDGNFEEAGYIHKEDLEAVGYVREESPQQAV